MSAGIEVRSWISTNKHETCRLLKGNKYRNGKNNGININSMHEAYAKTQLSIIIINHPGSLQVDLTSLGS